MNAPPAGAAGQPPGEATSAAATDAATRRSESRGSSWMRAAQRVALAAAGLGLIVFLVRKAGPAQVAHVLWNARSWMPLIVALELCTILGDFLTLRLTLGPRIPRASWVRSSALAYAMMILVPAGRAAGEVGRASMLSRHVGAVRAASASMRLQAAYVLALGLVSGLECALVVAWIGPRSVLAWLLAGNLVLMVVFSAGVLGVARNGRVGRWLERLAHRGSQPPPPGGPISTRLSARSVAICLASRTGEVVQYGVILRAVSGTVGVRRTVVAHGIHLFAATIGDVLPNGLGFVDAAFRTFARDLDFSPAVAISIAFVVHLAQIIVAAIALLVLLFTQPAALGPARTQEN